MRLRLQQRQALALTIAEDQEAEDPIVGYELYWIYSASGGACLGVVSPHLYDAHAACHDLGGTTKDFNIRSIRRSEKLARQQDAR